MEGIAMDGTRRSHCRNLQSPGIFGVPGTEISGVYPGRPMDGAFRAEIHLHPRIAGLPAWPEAPELAKKPGDRKRPPIPHGALT